MTETSRRRNRGWKEDCECNIQTKATLTIKHTRLRNALISGKPYRPDNQLTESFGSALYCFAELLSTSVAHRIGTLKHLCHFPRNVCEPQNGRRSIASFRNCQFNEQHSLTKDTPTKPKGVSETLRGQNGKNPPGNAGSERRLETNTCTTETEI